MSILKDVAKDFLAVVKGTVIVVYQIANLARKCLPPHFPIVTDVSKDIGMLIMQLDFRLRSLPFKLAKSLRQLLLIPRDMLRFAGSVSMLVKVMRGAFSKRAASLTAPQLEKLEMCSAAAVAAVDEDNTELVLEGSEVELTSLLGDELGAAAGEAYLAAKEAEAVPDAPPAGMTIAIQDDEEGVTALGEEDEKADDEVVDDDSDGGEHGEEMVEGAEDDMHALVSEQEVVMKDEVEMNDVEAPAPQSIVRPPFNVEAAAMVTATAVAEQTASAPAPDAVLEATSTAGDAHSDSVSSLLERMSANIMAAAEVLSSRFSSRDAEMAKPPATALSPPPSLATLKEESALDECESPGTGSGSGRDGRPLSAEPLREVASRVSMMESSVFAGTAGLPTKAGSLKAIPLSDTNFNERGSLIMDSDDDGNEEKIFLAPIVVPKMGRDDLQA